MGSRLDEEKANGPQKLLVTSRSLFTTHETRRVLGRKLPDARIHGSGFQGIYLVEAEDDAFELAERLYRECRRSIGRVTAAVAEVRSELSPIKDAAIRAATEHVRSEEKFCFRLKKRGSHFLDKDTPALEYEVGGAIWVALRERDRVEPKVDLSDPDVTIVADVLGPVTVIGIQRKAWAQGATKPEKRSDPPKLASSEAPQYPSYLSLQKAGLLEERARLARELLFDCTVCPRCCRVNRFQGREGICHTGALPVVSSYHPHFGEERALVGRQGSGTIFFTSCSLRCVFCQNWEISHLRLGHEVSYERLGEMMVELQSQGCHNINLVTPSHMIPQILSALPFAVERGLSIPLVYNTGGYDCVETLRLLEGVIDIYMPDIKYMDPKHSKRYSAAADYPQVVRAAVVEMHRQVGDLVLNEEGLAVRGLLVRHLVMPSGIAGTREVMRFLAREVSPNTYVNLMDQYFPWGAAEYYPEIARSITESEFQEALDATRQEGIWRLDPGVGARFGHEGALV
jgi:putative pyruvate formate lyase activating enzyme